MQKGEAWLVADHTRVLFQVSFGFTMAAPGDPEKGAHSIKAYPYFSHL